MVAKLEVTLKTGGCPAVKFVTKRLRVKTPTLKHGKYKGCSVPDVMRQCENYWTSKVARNPIKFVGSYSLFNTTQKEFEACEQKRLEQNQFRDLADANAFVEARRKPNRPVIRAPDYRYTGDEIIRTAWQHRLARAQIHRLTTDISDKDTVGTDKFFRDRLAPGHAVVNRHLVSRYELGHLESLHCCDLARYIQQEYLAGRYHYDAPAHSIDASKRTSQPLTWSQKLSGDTYINFNGNIRRARAWQKRVQESQAASSKNPQAASSHTSASSSASGHAVHGQLQEGMEDVS